MPVVALLTRHKKGILLAPALQPLGFSLFSTESWDTDRFGTFSGDIERPLPAIEMVRLKAILATDLTGCDYGLGSEGSFGGGPYPGILPWQQELVALFNRNTGQCVVGMAAGPSPLSMQQINDEDALALLLSRYPGQGWIIRTDDNVEKALTTKTELLTRVSSWPATLEPDWRAMYSPLRGQRIEAAANNLAQRLSSHCPACSRPDFWPDDIHTGLPCRVCGTPTHLIHRRIARCNCGFTQAHPIETLADPFDCPNCNP